MAVVEKWMADAIVESFENAGNDAAHADWVSVMWNNHWQGVYAETGRNPAPWPYEPKTPRYRPDDRLRPSRTFIPSYAWAQSPWRRDRVARPGGKR